MSLDQAFDIGLPYTSCSRLGGLKQTLIESDFAGSRATPRAIQEVALNSLELTTNEHFLNAGQLARLRP